MSVIKADVGSLTGHSIAPKELLEIASASLMKAKEDGLIIDYYVTHVGDDIELIMTHRKGKENEEIHKLSWDTFKLATEKAKELKLYGAGQDLLRMLFLAMLREWGQVLLS